MEAKSLGDMLRRTANRLPEKTAMQGQGAFNGMVGALAWPALRRKCDRLDPGYKN